MASIAGDIVVVLDEVEQSQAFREEGATWVASWVTERFGVASSTARSLAHVSEKTAGLPHLMGALRTGAVSLDKVRTVADVATPENDLELCEEAQRCSVRELADVARSRARDPRSSALTSAEQYERRFVRFNDQFRTVTAQLPAESYAEAKARLVLCRYHHGVVHRKGWSMTGNANEELTVVGPTGRVMVSRPSPLWTRVADRWRAAGPAG